MSCQIPLYPYSSLLPGADSIRLLRLRPPDGETATIRCQLFNYSLDSLDKPPPRYEALSYVWGDPKSTLPVFIDGYRFDVTLNLHAALLYLRNRATEWVWVDAICINQRDRQERGHQVRYMAKIYGKAHCVVVWLGQVEDNSDRAFEEIRARNKWSDSSDDRMIKQAVLALLQRPWFRRIWILQEIAAARRILVVCGLAEIDGYDFCLGLKSLEALYETRPDLHNLVRSVTYLIRQANFRPTHGICWSDMSFLAIRPLGELLDMFHTHKATERHDKVYALLGMSSGAPYAADLLPDYNVPWGQVVQRLIEFLLGKRVSLETWDDKETVVIKSKGIVLGEVSSVVPYSGWGDTHKVHITSKNKTAYLGSVGEWNASLTLHNSAKSIQPGDLVYLPQGALRPIVTRICKDYFAVIMITATPPEYIRTQSKHVRWSELLQSERTSPHDFLCIWDWTKTPEVSEEYEAVVETGSQMHEHSKAERKIARLENMALILEDLDEYEEAKERLQEAIRISERTFGKEHPNTLTNMNNLALIFWQQGRRMEAEELFVQVMETRKRVLRPEHLDTLTSIVDLASTYRDQGRWKKAEELEVQVMETRKRVLGPEHPGTLTSMANLALTYRDQGQWKKAEELEVQVMEKRKRVPRPEHPDTLTSMANLAVTYGYQGRLKEAEELEVQVMETRKRVLGPEHPDTLTSMANLALTYGNQGQWYKAEELEVQVMETRKRALRLEHPDMLSSIANLASTYRHQRRRKEAEELEVQVMETRKRVLGTEHPDTLTSVANLALTYGDQGRLTEAEKLEVQVMETRKRVLRPEHPDTLTSMNNLAYTFKAQGYKNNAILLMEECFQSRKKVLGPQHPCTTLSYSALKQWRQEKAYNSG